MAAEEQPDPDVEIVQLLGDIKTLRALLKDEIESEGGGNRAVVVAFAVLLRETNRLGYFAAIDDALDKKAQLSLLESLTLHLFEQQPRLAALTRRLGVARGPSRRSTPRTL